MPCRSTGGCSDCRQPANMIKSICLPSVYDYEVCHSMIDFGTVSNVNQVRRHRVRFMRVNDLDWVLFERDRWLEEHKSACRGFSHLVDADLLWCCLSESGNSLLATTAEGYIVHTDRVLVLFDDWVGLQQVRSGWAHQVFEGQRDAKESLRGNEGKCSLCANGDLTL